MPMDDLTAFEDQFGMLFFHAPMAMMAIAMNTGFILQANQAALNLLGFTREEVQGRTTIDLGIWVNPQQRSEFMHTVVSTGHLEKRPVNMHKKNGQVVCVELAVQRMIVDSSPFLIASFVDLSAQQALAEQLRATRDKLALALQGTDPGIWRCDCLKKLHLSVRAWEILGYDISDQIPKGVPLQALAHEADCGVFISALNGLSSASPSLDLDIRLRVSDADFRWFHLHGQAFDGNDGAVQPWIAVGTLVDIHSSKCRDLDIARRAQRAAFTISAADMGTWEFLDEGYAVWDPQTYRLYGYDPGTSKLPATIFREALSEAEYLRTGHWLGKSLKYGLALSIEFELHWPDGQTRWMAAKGKGILDAESGKRSLLGVNWDITDQRLAQDALNRYKHELSLLTNDLLEQEKRTTQKLATALHDQLGQNLTAAKLILDHQQQQPTQAGRHLETLMIEAIEVVRGLLVDLRPPLLEECGLAVALDNEVQRGHLPGIKTKLVFQCNEAYIAHHWPSNVEYAFFMIAREAIANAVSHADANLIVVRLAQEEAGLLLTVTDDGCGFNPKLITSSPGHLGLIGMRERALAIQARLELSSALGKGGRVNLYWTSAL